MEDSRDRQWHALFMRFAQDVAQMSRAIRLKVGAVAVRDRRVIAIGYNGTPEGEDNCCEELVITDKNGIEDDYDVSAYREYRDGENWVLQTKLNVIHAEDNLIRYADKHSIDLNGCTLYITHSPCPACGEKIIANGFKEVVFEKHYRVVTDLHFLIDKGIEVRQWKT